MDYELISNMSRVSQCFIIVMRSWLAAPTVALFIHYLSCQMSMRVAHYVNPNIRFTGIEPYGSAVCGVLGGLAMAGSLRVTRQLFRSDVNPRSAQIVGSAAVGLAVAFNSLTVGLFLFIPVLAVWNLLDSSVPSFIQPDDGGLTQLYRKGLCTFTSLGFGLGFLVAYWSARTDSRPFGK